MDNDQTSTFSYDGEGVPDKFNVSQLKLVVDRYFMEDCRLVKLAEGGYHKVYNVIRGDGVPLDAVVRVACPAFPRDKLESEVATYRFLTAFTKLPVPRIHAWNSDASNPVGAEYMIMDRIPGIPASMKWDSLSEEAKKNVVSQIAHHLLALFSLRFERAGSLYLDLTAAKFYVGPIVSTPFYRALDGFVRTPDIPISHNIDPNRGPFSTVSEYLSSFLKAELEFVSLHRSLALLEVQDSNAPSPESRLEQGRRVIEKAIELCLVYPGDIPVLGKYSHPEMPFGLKLNDFRLSNVMIDENSGRVTGFIDFEGATTAPLWECAIIPRWLQEPDDPESSYEGGSPEARSALRAVFLTTVQGTVQGKEWCHAYKAGRPFRQLVDRLNFQVNVWADLEEWVVDRLDWAQKYPGVGLSEEIRSEPNSPVVS